jgi:hypothetical protein
MGDQNHPAAPRQRSACAATGGVDIEQYGRRARPDIAAGRVGGMDDWQPDGGRHAVDIVAKRGIADQRQDPVECGHVLSVQRGEVPAPSHFGHLWMNANLWMNRTND